MNPTLQNLLWEKNPTGIQDFMYPLTEAELRQLSDSVREVAEAEAKAELNAAEDAWMCGAPHCDDYTCVCE